MKKISSIILALVLALSVFTVCSSALFTDGTHTEGETVALGKLDVATGKYTLGTAKLITRSYEGVTYLVIDPDSFVGNYGEVPAITVSHLDLLVKYTDETLTERAAAGININRFGHIDSLSIPAGTAIAPYVQPKLAAAGVDVDNHIWLVMGDKAGKSVTAYITVTDAEANGEGTTAAAATTQAAAETTTAAPETTTAAAATTQAAAETTTADSASYVTVKVVTPKRMSIRLEDGTVLKNGDSFKVKIGDTVRFQMCSNNWDNDTYTDDGNGICGTVVYKVTVSNEYNARSYDASSHSFVLPKGDLTLRTNTNTCFMAYRYSFYNGDYDHQTGIPQVVNTPLESLSVNLPLGSTITSNAFASYKQIATDNVFIKTGTNKNISWTNYVWNY